MLPLHIAASGVDPDVVEWIADQHPAAAEATSSGGLLPLHFAANSGLEEVGRYLAHRHPPAAQVPSTDDGWFPLHFAAKGHLLGPVQLLADMYPPALRERTAMGLLPLHFAAMPSDPDGPGRPWTSSTFSLGRGPRRSEVAAPLAKTKAKTQGRCRWKKRSGGNFGVVTAIGDQPG